MKPFSVCDRVNSATSSGDRPVCRDEREVKCDDLGENCVTLASHRCEVTEVDLPAAEEVKCRKEKVKVCGPETCPLVRDSRKCGTELKTVEFV